MRPPIPPRGLGQEYYFVSSPPRRLQSVARASYRDAWRGFWGSLTLRITTVKPLFVGSGELDVATEPRSGQRKECQLFARSAGRTMFLVPGTTIKGVVRTYAEALSPSCEGGDCRGDAKCVCCALFGAQGLQGRVCFCDSWFTATPSLYPMAVRYPGRLRDNRRFYYLEKPRDPRATGEDGRVDERREELVQVVPKGTTIPCDLLFENLSLEEMGLLILAMGLSPRHLFDLKMGGGKDRLLGRVRFSAESARLGSASDYHGLRSSSEEKTLDSWCSGDPAADPVEAYLGSLGQGDRRLVEQAVGLFQSDDGPRRQIREGGADGRQG